MQESGKDSESLAQENWKDSSLSGKWEGKSDLRNEDERRHLETPFTSPP